MCTPARCGLWCWRGSVSLGRRGLARRRSSWRRPRTAIGLRRCTLLRRGKPSSPITRPGAAARQRPCRHSKRCHVTAQSPSLLRPLYSALYKLTCVSSQNRSAASSGVGTETDDIYCGQRTRHPRSSAATHATGNESCINHNQIWAVHDESGRTKSAIRALA